MVEKSSQVTKGDRVTLKHPKASRGPTDDLEVAPLFGLEGRTIPRHKLPRGELSPDVAYQIIHDELMLDGNPRLNLASFVTTWMEPECDKLIMDSINKNYVDMDEYPVTTELQVTTYLDRLLFPNPNSPKKKFVLI